MKNSEQLSKVFRAMATPTRVSILQILAQGERCPSDLMGVAKITTAALSTNLRVLRDANLIRARRDGRWVHYSINDKHICEIKDFLSQNLLCEDNELHRFPR